MANAGSFWDQEIVTPQHVSWLEHPLFHEYANELIGNGTPTWPLDWFVTLQPGRRFPRALSVGCGGGALERDLVGRNLVDVVDAFDASMSSLALARAAARELGIGERIRYFAADFNEPRLPRRTYDLVVFHQSAHHVAKLEKLFRAILLTLRPGGVLYLDEYVGPSRFEWTDTLLAEQRRVYSGLPESVRTAPGVPYPIQKDDPSEAYRSSEIEPQLRVGFRTVARRPYGGTLLSVLFPLLRQENLTPSVSQTLVNEERRILAGGMSSYYALIVAHPHRGLMKVYADLHYFFVPKVKRLMRDWQAYRERRAQRVRTS